MSEQAERNPSTSSRSADAQQKSRARRGPRRRTNVAPATIESYLRGNSAPRYMRRLRDIETEFQAQRRRLEAAYGALVDALGHDGDRFSEAWRTQVRAWRFDRLNELIREHNMWYPMEANLPMDPRTRDYRAVRGQSYRRIELGPEWVLEHFPPALRSDEAPPLPRRAPREPLPAAARPRSPSGC